MINKVKKYLNEVKSEMAKVSWPTKEELASSTVIVLVMTLLCAIFVFVTDQVLSKILRIFLKL